MKMPKTISFDEEIIRHMQENSHINWSSIINELTKQKIIEMDNGTASFTPQPVKQPISTDISDNMDYDERIRQIEEERSTAMLEAEEKKKSLEERREKFLSKVGTYMIKAHMSGKQCYIKYCKEIEQIEFDKFCDLLIPYGMSDTVRNSRDY